MTEKIHKLLSDSKAARWSALAVVSFTMMCGYYLTDVMAPMKGMLETQLGWNSTDFGIFTSAYGWFNVLLLMLIFGGIILDKMGVRFTGVMSASVMVAGAAIKFWAVSTHVFDNQVWSFYFFDMKAQVCVAALGFAIFGVGVEVAGITVSKVIVKWFRGKEMALAMGLQMATARLGTAAALASTVPLAKYFGTVSAPILLCLIMLCIGLIAFIVYTFMDKKLEVSQAEHHLANNTVATEDDFRVSDIGLILKNKAWWYIAILCVLFYSAVFPFLKYASDLMVQKFGVPDDLAGTIPALLPFGTILLTPFFGGLYDKKGKGATIMIIGAVLLIFVHTLFAVPFLNNYIVAIALTMILGVGFSLVPSAMWPSVPKIIPEKQLGTAYALIFYIQNIGLSGVPAIIGWVLSKYCITSAPGAPVTTYNYTIPMMIFTSLGVLALIFAFLLKAEDKKKGYGLELPNMK